MWAAVVARLRAVEADLAVDIITQIHLGISTIISYGEVVVEKLDVLAWRLAAAVQCGHPVATQCRRALLLPPWRPRHSRWYV